MQPQIIASIFCLFEIACGQIKFVRVQSVAKTRSATMAACLLLHTNLSDTAQTAADRFAARHLTDEPVSTPPPLAGCRGKLSAGCYRMEPCRPGTRLIGGWRCTGCANIASGLFAGDLPVVQRGAARTVVEPEPAHGAGHCTLQVASFLA